MLSFQEHPHDRPHRPAAAGPRRLRGRTRAALSPSGGWSGRSSSSTTWGRWSSRRASRASVDVRPHPHIGLSTVTYLFEGEITHRDSLGVEQAIRPGRGELDDRRARHHPFRALRARCAREGGRMHGIQAWVALPDEQEETEPAFAHHAAADLPTYEARRHVGAAGGRARRSAPSAPVQDPLAAVLRALGAGGRRAGAAAGGLSGARRLCRAGRGGGGRPRRTDEGQMLVFAPGEPVTFTRGDRRDRHAAGRRAGGRAVHRVELRRLVQGAHRAGQGRLARRPHEAARPRQREFIPLPEEAPVKTAQGQRLGSYAEARNRGAGS